MKQKKDNLLENFDSSKISWLKSGGKIKKLIKIYNEVQLEQLSTESNTHVTNTENRLEFNNKGVLEVPVFKARGTTFADRDSMTAEAGMILFNTSNNKFQGYTGTTWVDLH